VYVKSIVIISIIGHVLFPGYKEIIHVQYVENIYGEKLKIIHNYNE